tara:strand:+ start:1282 stop:2493 length:1212 start_codon:yes stop_codon:yes gene_type:complete
MRKFLLFFGLVGFTVTAFFGTEGFRQSDSIEAEPHARNTFKVMRRDIGQQVSATGVINPIIGAEVKVGSLISGTLKKLHVTIGSRVKAGDVVAQIDTADLNMNIQKAKADLAGVRANLAILLRGSRPEEIQQAEFELKKVEADTVFAEKKLNRAQILYEKKTLSRNDLDLAIREYDVAASNLRSFQVQLKLAKNKYTQEDRDLAHAKVALAEATLEEAKLRLSYATILAPVSGVVASVSVIEGENVPHSQSVLTITDLRRLQVNAYVDETDIGRIHKNQAVRFTVDAFPELEFRGKVAGISPKGVIQGNVVTYDVQVAIKDTKNLLKPDMTTSVMFDLKKKNNVLVVFRQAIQRVGGKKFVTVLGENDSLLRKEVRTGWKEANFVEIVEGIEETDVILIEEND